MEASTLKPDVKAAGDLQEFVDGPENPERVLKFSPSFKERVAPLTALTGDRNSPKRDWSSALDLVNEAFEAIRIAEERAAAAEEYHQQLVVHHGEQMRGLEARLMATERRAEAAEGRAKEAEGWLAKFHDTIVDGFQRTFITK